MDLGAFHIPQEDWPLAADLGLKYAFNADGIWEIVSGDRIGEYFYDDVEAPNRPSREEFELLAQGVFDRGLIPATSVVPSFLGTTAGACRDWGKAQGVWMGYQAYSYQPLFSTQAPLPIPLIGPLWDRLNGAIQRQLVGRWHWKHRAWFGVAQSVYSIYSPSDRWVPLTRLAIRSQIWQFRLAGAAATIFFPWRKDAFEHALG